MQKIANIPTKNFANVTLSKFFFYVFLFLLPIQTRKIFFTSQSFYYGYNAFYNTFYLYLTDLVILCLMIAWIWESRNQTHFFLRFKTFFLKDKIYWFFGTFWLILAISILFSRENFLGLYGLLKITEFFLIFAYIRGNVDFSREKGKVFWLILASSWFQAVLGVYQYLTQQSFGLKILGEEFLRPGIKGIAEFVSQGVLNPAFFHLSPILRPISELTVNIRAYGTMPHPNVLAGFLFAALLINLYLLYVSREKLILSASLVLVSTGLVVTFSRLAWVLAGLAMVVWFGLIFARIRRPQIEQMKTGALTPETTHYQPARLGLIVVVLLVALGLNLVLFSGQIRDRLGAGEVGGRQNYATDESLINRELYNGIAWQMIKHQPVFGVGLKNFIVNMDAYAAERLLPYLHQPVHNIYLLIAAESGILALLVFLIFLFYIVRHAFTNQKNPVLRYTLFLLLGGFLVIGLFDHYLWTIQQGSLMFWVVLGLLATKKYG